jgi:hypothetical protein
MKLQFVKCTVPSLSGQAECRRRHILQNRKAYVEVEIPIGNRGKSTSARISAPTVSKEYWPVVKVRITGFLGFDHRQKLENATFGNWSCFRPQVNRRASTPLGPLERASLNYWATHVNITGTNTSDKAMPMRSSRGTPWLYSASERH